MSDVKNDITELLAEQDDVDTDDLELETLSDGNDDVPESEFKDEDELEEEPVEEEEATKEVVKKPSEELTEKGKERLLSQDVKQVLAQLDKDETIKSKGLEVKASEFTPEELGAFLNKGFRFYQHMDELSQREGSLLEREHSLSRAAVQLQDLQTRLDQKVRTMTLQTKETTMPRELEVDELNDTPEQATLKKAAQVQWKSNQELRERIGAIEGGFERRQSDEQEQALLSEIERYKTDFPMASPEETIAVHYLSKGKIPVQKIMQRGQSIYGSAKFVQKVFKACPDVRKAISDEMIKEYLSKQKHASSKRVPLKTSSGATHKPVETPKKSAGVTFENVGSAVKKALAERERLESGEEL